jgi:NAD(P)H-dependent FMN reductase
VPVLQIIVASTRSERVGPPIAQWIAERARERAGFEVQLVDLAEAARSATVDAADALVLVMPEYNRGFNAALKNAIDYLNFDWHCQPVGFVSYGKASAGLRAVQTIKQVVTTREMTPVAIHYVGQCIKHGRFVPTAVMESSGKAMLDELGRLTPAVGAVSAGSRKRS